MGMIFEEAPNVAASNNDDWGFWAVKAGYAGKPEIEWCYTDAESQNRETGLTKNVKDKVQ
jgi:hypothetical protein